MDKVDNKIGSILIPEDTRMAREQAQTSGILVDIGPLAFAYDIENEVIPQIGDRVAFPKYSGLVLKGPDKTEYRVLKDGDLAAILSAETPA